MLAPERRQAELNNERKQKLFYRFASRDERDRAIREIETSREFADEFSHVDHFGPDTNPAHQSDGLMLRLDNFDPLVLNKIENYFNRLGLAVKEKNEWIVEPDEQSQEEEKRLRAASAPLPAKPLRSKRAAA